MWLVGFITSLVYTFVFFSAKFYAGMGLHGYYVLISVYGYIQWSRQGNNRSSEDSDIIYRRLSWTTACLSAVVFVVAFIGIYYVLRQTDSPVPLGDSFVTALSIVGTWMLAKRMIEHWACWVVVEVVSVYLYYTQGLYPTAILYACYTIMVFVGIYIWIKNGRQINDNNL